MQRMSRGTPLCTMQLPKVMVNIPLCRIDRIFMLVPLGDAAIALLKAGAGTDIRDLEGRLALELAPDKQVYQYIARIAEMEGLELPIIDPQ